MPGHDRWRWDRHEPEVPIPWWVIVATIAVIVVVCACCGIKIFG